MIVNYDQAQVRPVSDTYANYRDRVVEAGGAIGSATATQAALDVLETLPGVVQWLDARHGLSATAWHSICGPSADAFKTNSGSPTLGNDATLGGELTLGNGGWNGGTTPELGPHDTYTWGMKYLQVGPGVANGFFWGNRYGNTAHPGSNVWNYLVGDLWRSYFDGDASIPLALPIGSWQWIWGVQDEGVMSLYDAGNTSLGSTACTAVGELPVGIAGGTDSTGVTTGNTFRYQTFVRASTALTAAQRASIQAI